MESVLKLLNNTSYDVLNTVLSKVDRYVLYELKRKLDDEYYNKGTPLTSDIRYDMIVDVIKNDDDYIPEIGAKLREGENRVKIPVWMGSTDKITPKDVNLFQRWMLKNNAELYTITDKLDGVSCLYVNKNGITSLYTRGDGTIGSDISYLKKYFKLPKIKDDILVRGELIINRENFSKVDNYKNARNMVAGLVGAKTSRKELVYIDFVAYEIVDDYADKQTNQLKRLEKLGFNTVRYQCITRKELTISNLQDIYLESMDNSDYDIDGLIVQSNIEYDRNPDGNPSYNFAFKMLTGNAVRETEVVDVEWNISKWNQYKPTAHIKETEINGTTIKKVTAHNAKYVFDNKLGKGSKIKITKSNEVIPYILEVITESKEHNEPKKYIWDKNKVNILCVENTDESNIKTITHILSSLGIKYVSESTVKKLYDKGYNTFLKIIQVKKSDINMIPNLGDKSAERICDNISQGLKNVNISVLVGSSGILGYGIGVKRLDSLLLDIPDLFESNYTKEELRKKIEKIEGFSKITTDKILENIDDAKKFINDISKYCTFKRVIRVNNDLTGKQFVFTGFRDTKLNEEISNRGGKVTTGVSKKTTCVVLANLSSKATQKIEKAKELGIEIIVKEDFIDKYIGK